MHECLVCLLLDALIGRSAYSFLVCTPRGEGGGPSLRATRAIGNSDQLVLACAGLGRRAGAQAWVSASNGRANGRASEAAGLSGRMAQHGRRRAWQQGCGCMCYAGWHTAPGLRGRGHAEQASSDMQWPVHPNTSPPPPLPPSGRCSARHHWLLVGARLWLDHALVAAMALAGDRGCPADAHSHVSCVDLRRVEGVGLSSCMLSQDAHLAFECCAQGMLARPK